MSGRVVHVRDGVPDAVYVGRRRRFDRGTDWGNPFCVGEDGTRSQVVDRYRAWIVSVPSLLRRLPEVRGRPLACWCRHDGEPRAEATACHADVLLDLLDAHTDDELRAMAEARS